MHDSADLTDAVHPHLIHGELLWDDGAVDPGTGQIRSRALLANPHHHLLPGMFVRATLTWGTPTNAIFISQKSLRFAGDGTASVQIVDDQDVLMVRPVILGEMQGGAWEVLQGLAVNERVVLDPSSRISAGTKVNATLSGVADAPSTATSVTGAPAAP